MTTRVVPPDFSAALHELGMHQHVKQWRRAAASLGPHPEATGRWQGVPIGLSETSEAALELEQASSECRGSSRASYGKRR
jgi:hypothetical protein